MLTITLNAALDVTYTVERLQPGASHTVTSVRAQAGGKGINVARVLAGLGERVTATGLVGGATGAEIRRDLASTSIGDSSISVGGDSRRTLVVVDDEGATAFNEPGDGLEFTWRHVEPELVDLIPHGSVVIASGSLPSQAPPDAYARLTREAHARGSAIVVDASGEPLLLAAAAGADLVKPNAEELERSTGHRDAAAGAAVLLALGARCVAVSLGPDGMLLCTADETARARPPGFVSGNPTGAGDAAVAALSLGLRDGLPLSTSAVRAVALSAAAVAHPLAGHVDAGRYREFLTAVTLEGGFDDAHHHRHSR